MKLIFLIDEKKRGKNTYKWKKYFLKLADYILKFERKKSK